jgi:NAD(P)-dependent dehydrogenase (short-subunit alcohol dehydrogenase family)
MRLTRAFSPFMAKKKQGTIINIASIAGEIMRNRACCNKKRDCVDTLAWIRQG